VTILTANGSSYEIIPDFQTRFHEAYCLELQHFAECVRSGKAPIVTDIDATINLEVGIAATHSYRSGRPVQLDEKSAYTSLSTLS
jgi:scyllo-inositol 2-dehydrogenase (NAD+)